MQQAEEMPREKQINFRVSAEEAERFDRVAARYGLPVAATIRMLVKEKEEAHAAAEAQSVGLTRVHHDVMWQFSGAADRTSSGDIARALNRIGYDAKWGGLGRALNELCRGGFLKRVGQNAEEEEMDRNVGNYHGKIYVPTPKGLAYIQTHWK
jgi:hypothetical protein